MLVLGRKVGERIVIGGNITITYLRDKRGYIQLGIDAPKDVDIARGELIDQRQDRESKERERAE